MKNYLKPITEFYYSDLASFVCGSKGGREGSWGAGTGDGGNQYAYDDWNNQGGQGSGQPGGTDPIGDDYGDLNSTAKEWGDLWGDLGF
jgi:hypothetical protein